MHLAESGFLSWINVSQLGSGSEVALYLNREALVSVNAGDSYGYSGKGYIRVVHGVMNEVQLEAATKRMRAALLKLAKAK